MVLKYFMISFIIGNNSMLAPINIINNILDEDIFKKNEETKTNNDNRIQCVT